VWKTDAAAVVKWVSKFVVTSRICAAEGKSFNKSKCKPLGFEDGALSILLASL
jgi:hypothetical protein